MSSRLRTAVIPLAGRGTRFLPVTKAVPKELLPVGDRPCIEYIVAEAVEAGLERVIFVTSRGKESLLDYFDRSPELEAHLEAAGKHDCLAEVRRVGSMARVVGVRQRHTRGLGHAVACARTAVGDEPFAVFLGDEIVDAERPAIAQLMDAWASREPGAAVVALMDVSRQQTSRYGICAGAWQPDGLLRVASMVEKPDPADAPGTLAIVGRYILPPDLFDVLEATPPGRHGEVQLTDAIAVLAGQGRVYGRLLDGERFDTGNPLGLLHASLHFLGQRPDLAEGVAALARRYAGPSGREG